MYHLIDHYHSHSHEPFISTIFSIGFGFVDDIKQTIANAKEEIFSFGEDFTDLVNIPGLSGIFGDMKDGLLGNFPEGLLALDFDCEDITCVTDKLGEYLGFSIPDLNANIPALSIGGVDVGIPDDLLDSITDVLQDIEGFALDFTSLLEGGAECNEYKMIRANLNEVIRESFGLDEGDIAGIPDCDFSFKICTSVIFPQMDAFTTSVSQRLSNLGLDRRRLETCSGDADGGGVAIPLGPFFGPLTNEIYDKIMKKFFKGFNILQERTASPADLINEDVSYKKAAIKKILGPLFFTIFSYSTKLVVGAVNVDGDCRFQAKIRVGGFLNAGLDISPIGWTGWTKEARHTIKDNERGSKKFNEDADKIERFAEINCLLDYIEGTLLFFLFDYKYEIEVNLNLYETFKETVFETLEFSGEIVGQRDTLRRAVTSKFEWQKEYLERESFNSEKTLKRLQKQKDLCEKYRAKVDRVYLFRDQQFNWLSLAKEILKDEYGYFKFPMDDNCVLPPGDDIRKELISGVNFFKDRAIGIARYFGLRSGTTTTFTKEEVTYNFFGSKLYQDVISGIEIQPFAYGNLFGAGLDISITKKTILGNFKVDETEFKAGTLVGPAWVAGGDWTPPAQDAFADVAPWNLVEFLLKSGLSGFQKDSRDNPTKKSSLIDAILDAPEEADFYAFASKYGLKIEFSFFELSLSLTEPFGESDASQSCLGPVCIGKTKICSPCFSLTIHSLGSA